MPDLSAATPASRRILATAEDLFYSRGITAVGVDLIAEHSGVTKRTLYDRFGSKDALVAEYLAGRDQRWREAVLAAIEACDDAGEAVLAPFAALRTWTATSTRGCAFINALAELPDPAHPAHRIAVDQKRWLHRLFADLATRAGCAEPAALATRLLLLHEGALATQPLGLGTVSESMETARELVRASLSESLSESEAR
ncbi:TetR/AcrR family transcriptional regulator [Ruania suaedae]|uniref:TetR/AcrR family transcriptional regulator n=1 Tax=Ruania suaedae TaxID=2897774 RepID=UPI001E39D9EE|nr:TetR/AcrR family transcriptional regulator [Ruania suaedae]UFU01688.1 TetR/AcrR family transcriptional regulator [Ruania suaedae]